MGWLAPNPASIFGACEVVGPIRGIRICGHVSLTSDLPREAMYDRAGDKGIRKVPSYARAISVYAYIRTRFHFLTPRHTVYGSNSPYQTSPCRVALPVSFDFN